MCSSYLDSLDRLQAESGLSLEKYDAADNVDLGLILTEYEAYYELKFGKKPKLSRKVNPVAEGMGHVFCFVFLLELSSYTQLLCCNSYIYIYTSVESNFLTHTCVLPTTLRHTCLNSFIYSTSSITNITLLPLQEVAAVPAYVAAITATIAIAITATIAMAIALPSRAHQRRLSRKFRRETGVYCRG